MRSAESSDSSERFKKFEESIMTQLSQVEEELTALTKPQTLSKPPEKRSQSPGGSNFANFNNNSNNNKNNNNNNNDNNLPNQIPSTLSGINPTSSRGNALAPYWEQVLTFVRQGQDEEAIYALVRVVQRLLDEKAYAKTLSEKASKSYVDNLFERVSTGVKDNLLQSTADSCENLENQVMTLAQKIGEVKIYFQRELRDVKNQIASLKEDVYRKNTDTDQNENGADSQRTQSSFTVCPPKLYR